MTFIGTIDEEAATGVVHELYQRDRDRIGYVANYTKLFSHRPEMYEAWQALSATIRSVMDLRRYELVTVAAARRLRSTYCTLAHGSLLADRFLDPARVRALMAGGSAELDPVDAAIMSLAEKVIDDATAVTEADLNGMRDLGLSDDDIFDVVVAAAARSFFSKTLDALGCQPDAALLDLEPELRDALTVGRPIADSHA